MPKSGAEIIIESLKKEGVEAIFGYPGGTVLPFYDALYDSDLKHYLVRHEQGAAHAADGYARATGKPGVCLATSGPGATNLVTGIATAYMDSVPLIALTGQVACGLLGSDSFQEADITGITLPITKHNFLVKDVDDLARTIKEAFHIATTGRPGPVLIDLPKDIQVKQTKFNYPESIQLKGYKPTVEGNKGQTANAAKLISAARKPVIYAGGGVIISGAESELLRLAELTLSPVTTTLMGKGAFPETHPLSLGMLGMHGTWPANYAVCECDLLIAVGARFGDRVTGKIDEFAPEARIIHIDIDPAEIGKNVQIDVPIVGDLKKVLAEVNEKLEQNPASDWQDKIGLWKAEHPLKYETNGTLKPQFIIEEIYDVTKGEAIIVTEVGQNQMWAAQYYKYTKPRTFISSGGLGTMGYGLPAAIGAKVGCPDSIVIDIAGDGSIQMNIQELATAVQYNIPVIVAILNNNYLGMVRQWQEIFYDRRYSYTDITGPDFVKLAEAYGAMGIRVTDAKDVKPAMKQAIAANRPVVIDFVVEREENVFPMVPPGGAIHKMLGG
ncbi:MAG: biosynthetic-type acetolactate synthase large subunit [Thermincola sp.]|nr:biosynthetic-type acetolactate synthase large subunit [Thermincola sp.]MDT3702867.1 biosynthetic-type acetolactate synthase large subunit [Thermincola sp.]